MRRFSTTFLALSLVFLLAACGVKIGSAPESDKQKVIEYSAVKTVGGKASDPVHGDEEEFWYGALAGIGETNANGVAFIRRYTDGVFVVTSNLNILPVKKPASFSVSLKNDVSGAMITVGELTSIIGDVRHSAKLETKEDLRSFLHVVVLRHSSAGDAGTVVAEGTLKKPQAK